MPDIYVVVWDIPYEGQNVCGAYLTQAEADARIAEIEAKDQTSGLGWIRCVGGQPVASSGIDISLWTLWNTNN